MEHAIYKGNLLSWPVENLHFSKLIKTTLATKKGHLDQEQKYLNSTKMDSILCNNFPQQSAEQANNIFTQIFHPLVNSNQPQQKAYIDLTGRFPRRSSRGNTHVFLMYDYDSNAILIEPLKTR